MKSWLSVGSLALLAACSSTPPPATPAPMPAPAPAAAPPAAATADRLTGTWDFSVDAGGQIIPGEMNVTRSGANYGGTVSPQGMSQATIRSASIAGDRVVMVIDTPDGEATFNGTFSTDGRNLTGTVAYNGQSLGFTARKR